MGKKMPKRTIAIGDIHGCHNALETLLASVAPREQDTIVTLGDYVDRGPQSREVIDRLIALQASCRLIPLLGNHDQMFLLTLSGRSEEAPMWLGWGGEATLTSYAGSAAAGLDRLGTVPQSHKRFLARCRAYYETSQFMFIHASYDPALPLERQFPEVLHWESVRDAPPGPHVSGKTAIVGHTSQKSGEILDLGYLVCIDTYCYGGGWLTAFEPVTRLVWQANEVGETRRFVLPARTGSASR